jgi:hypothetical protein
MSLTWVKVALCLRLLNQNEWHTTVGRTPLEEELAPRRDIYLTTHNTQETVIHAGGIRTRNTWKRAAAEPHLRFAKVYIINWNLYLVIIRKDRAFDTDR